MTGGAFDPTVQPLWQLYADYFSSDRADTEGPSERGLADPDRPGALTETIDLGDRAVATSAGAGFRFDAKGRFTHLFDPATGGSPSLQYAQRHRAYRNGGRCALDRVEPDAAIADPKRGGLPDECSGPHHDVGRNLKRLWCVIDGAAFDSSGRSRNSTTKLCS